MSQFITCDYCRSKNPTVGKQCIACGAPLPELINKPPRIPIHYPQEGQQIKEAQTYIKEDQTVEAATKVARVYSHFWRSVIEALVIALVGFAIGFTGALVGYPLVGITGAFFLGLSVGLTIKYPLLTLFSAPLGLFAGSLMSIAAFFLKAPPISYILLMTFCACIAALLGGASLPMVLRTKWQKIRPFLGAVGGLVFGILGSLLGSALHLVYTIWL